MPGAEHCCQTGDACIIYVLDIEIMIYEIIFWNVHIVFGKDGLAKKVRKSNITGSAEVGN